MVGRNGGGAGTETGGYTRRAALLAGGLLAGASYFDVVAGAGLLSNDPYIVMTEHTMYLLDVTGWQVLHVVVGAVIGIAGLVVMYDRRWTAVLGIVAAFTSIGLHVLVFPYHPVRAVGVSLFAAAAIRLLVRRRRWLRATSSD